MTDLLIGIRKSDPDDGKLRVYVEEGSALPGAGDFCAIGFDAEAERLDTLENVASYGKMLRAELTKHKAINTEFAQLFASIGDNAAFLKFLVVAGEEVRWESLCDDAATFLVLNAMIRIARVTMTTADAPKPRQAQFPLKILAYLSAAGVSAKEEFRNICAQIIDARAKGLDIEADIFVGEQEIVDSPADVAGVAKDAVKGFVVAPMPVTSEIEQQLAKRSYQFLHFFCHGVEREAGLRGLSLATIADHERGDKDGSVFLSLEGLTTALRVNQSAWIAVFNSCSGAEGTRDFNSLAWNAAKRGCPYTVGMAEPIEPIVAAKFSRAFYSELFATVMVALRDLGDSTPRVIDLSGVLNPARKAILSHCQTIDRRGPYGRWLTPLIYMRTPKPLAIYVQRQARIGEEATRATVDANAPQASVDKEMMKRIQTISSTLRVLPADTPQEVRNGILDLLDKAPPVPDALRPDAFGQFHTNGAGHDGQN